MQYSKSFETFLYALGEAGVKLSFSERDFIGYYFAEDEQLEFQCSIEIVKTGPKSRPEDLFKEVPSKNPSLGRLVITNRAFYFVENDETYCRQRNGLRARRGSRTRRRVELHLWDIRDELSLREDLRPLAPAFLSVQKVTEIMVPAESETQILDLLGDSLLPDIP